MFTVVVFFIVLSVLVLIHEFGHFFAAKKNGVKVEEFGFGLPPRAFGIKFGETLYSLNWLPFGGFVRVFGEDEAQLKGKKLTKAEKDRSFAHKKPWQKIIILTAGVIMNFILGWVIISYLFVKGLAIPTGNVIIDTIQPNSPAAEAEMQPEDIIKTISHEGKVITVDEDRDVITASQKYKGKTITIALSRGSETVTVNVVPRVNPPAGEGALGIAIHSESEIKQYSAMEAPFYGLGYSAQLTGKIGKELVTVLGKFVTFQKPGVEVAGPVGIAKMVGEAARISLDALLLLTGILSLNLAVINILPFPALDGGRLVVVIYEWATKKKVNPDIERKLNVAGFIFLIGLILLVTANDIIKLFN